MERVPFLLNHSSKPYQSAADYRGNLDYLNQNFSYRAEIWSQEVRAQASHAQAVRSARSTYFLAASSPFSENPGMNCRALSLFIALSVLTNFWPLIAATRVTPAEFGDAKQPQFAVNSKGEIFVVFGNAHGVWFSSLKHRDKSFSAPAKIAGVPGLALGMRRGPRIAVNGSSITVTAISHTSGNLLNWHSANAGVTWSKESIINEIPNSAREGMHGLAGDGNGNVFVLWLDLRESKTQLWGAKSTDGGKSWAKNIRLYKSPDETICECCHPSVAFGPKGEIIAMWRNWLGGNRDLYRSVSVDGGQTFSDAAKLGTGSWRLQACPMDGGSLAVAGEQTIYVWRREMKVFATTTPGARETLITASGAHPIALPAPNGPFEFIWQDSGNLYRKRLDQTRPVLLAKNAAYASSAWDPRTKTALVVWEGTSGDITSVFLQTIN